MITRFDRPFELTNPIPDTVQVKDVKKRIDQEFGKMCNIYRNNTNFPKSVTSLTFDMNDRKSGTVHINVKGRPVMEDIEPVVEYLNFSMNPVWRGSDNSYVSSIETIMRDMGCCSKEIPAFNGDAAKLEDVYATAETTRPIFSGMVNPFWLFMNFLFWIDFYIELYHISDNFSILWVDRMWYNKGVLYERRYT